MVYTTNASTYMGPVEIGLFIAMVLFGCSIVQGYLYFSTFRKDPLVFKAMVAATLALESAYIISVASCVWTMTISSVNDPSLLLVYPIGAELGLVFTIFISGITEAFFIYRLVKFSKTLAFPALCGTISFLTVISGMIVAGEAFRMTSVAEFQTTQFRLINLLLVSDSACALLITTGMVYHLRKSRSRGLPRTVSTIDRLIVWTLETGLATSLTSAAAAICLLSMKHNLVYGGIYLTVASTYTNSLLASLNSRLRLSAKNSGEAYDLSSSDPDINTIPNHQVVINISRTMVRDGEDKVDERPSDLVF